jgi:serine/threonine-protein kinase
MGSVWMAEHMMIGRRVAIKMLHAHISRQPDLTTRFFNEAKAAAAIQDAGIVQIFDFGHHTDGRAYIVMELLDGESLERRLERLGRLALGEALRIMHQVANSLGAVHQHGIVHRDLKPDNIFLVRDLVAAGGERAKILDFGIAKIAGASGMKTEISVVMGTPMFMSPEQCRGAGLVDQRSDVYSLGCVLFMLITGRTPFVAEGTGEIIAMHLREPAPAPSSLVLGVPHAVDALVLRCMEKDPARRFASAADLSDALAAQLPAVAVSQQMSAVTPLSDPVSMIRIMAPGQQATTLSTYAQTASQGRSAHKQRSPLIGWLYVGLAAATLSTGAVVVTSVRDASESSPPRTENVTIGASMALSPVVALVTAPVTAPDLAPKIEPPTASAAQDATAMAAPTEELELDESAVTAPPAPVGEDPPRSPPESASAAAAAVASKPAPAAQTRRPTIDRPTIDRPNLEVIGTRPQAAPAAAVEPTTTAPEVCADQAAKVDAFISRSYSMAAAAAVKAARALDTSCLDAKQRLRLALVAIPIACSINDRASVMRFFKLAPSESLRARCKQLLPGG